jgi:hypothetical protein
MLRLPGLGRTGPRVVAVCQPDGGRARVVGKLDSVPRQPAVPRRPAGGRQTRSPEGEAVYKIEES